MTTEKEIETSFAEAVLDIIKNPAHETNVDTFCHEYHLDRTKLTSKRLFSLNQSSMCRLMIGIAQLGTFVEYMWLCIRFAVITYRVANMEDGSPEAIINSHAGSPIKRKKH